MTLIKQNRTLTFVTYQANWRAEGNCEFVSIPDVGNRINVKKGKGAHAPNAQTAGAYPGFLSMKNG